ncbi:MAG: hypothetical protein QNK23_08490 [Crocinitomicaceae bacterium]|nr:hypothetical protein [Crocinitomicaceae bacterium]
MKIYRIIFVILSIVLIAGCKKEEPTPNEPDTPPTSSVNNFTYRQFTGNANRVYGYYAAENSNLHAYFLGNTNVAGDFSSLDKIYLRNDLENRNACLKLDNMGRPKYWVSFDSQGALNPYSIEFGYDVLLNDTLYNMVIGKGVNWSTGEDSVYFSLAINSVTSGIFISKQNDQTLDEATDETIEYANCAYPVVCDIIDAIEAGVDDAGVSITQMGQDAVDLVNSFTISWPDFSNMFNNIDGAQADPVETFDPSIYDETEDVNNLTFENIEILENNTTAPNIFLLEMNDDAWWCNSILSSGDWTQMPYVDDGTGTIVVGHPQFVSGWFLKFQPSSPSTGTVTLTAMPPYTGSDVANYSLNYATGAVNYDFLGCSQTFSLKPGTQEYYVNACGSFNHHMVYK